MTSLSDGEEAEIGPLFPKLCLSQQQEANQSRAGGAGER